MISPKYSEAVCIIQEGYPTKGIKKQIAWIKYHKYLSEKIKINKCILYYSLNFFY